ncbi:MAG: hypothetical protein RLZZ628_2880 [Bacteroidota bacterium]|jgi:hypothetical protein
MPKSGYITSLEGLNYWFDLPTHKNYKKVEVTETDDKGKRLYYSDADSHEFAWTQLKRFMESFGAGGLFWIRFLVPKGHESVGIGLDLNPFSPTQPANIAGINEFPLAKHLELEKLKWENEEKSKINGINGIFGSIAKSIESSPTAGTEAIRVLHTAMNGVFVLGNSLIGAIQGIHKQPHQPHQQAAHQTTQQTVPPAEAKVVELSSYARLDDLITKNMPDENKEAMLNKIILFVEKDPSILHLIKSLPLEAA